MNGTLRFSSNAEAIESLENITGARIIIADSKKGILDKIKGWLKEKWSGFREIDMVDLSSAISMARYNKKGKILEIKFKRDGKTYQYRGVPERVMEQFLSANSKGKFFNKKIRDKFTYKRVASKSDRRVRIASRLSRSTFVGRMLAKQGMLEKYQRTNSTSHEPESECA